MELAGRASAERETLIVHNYVVVEAAALLQRRLGLEVTVRASCGTPPGSPCTG